MIHVMTTSFIAFFSLFVCCVPAISAPIEPAPANDDRADLKAALDRRDLPGCSAAESHLLAAVRSGDWPKDPALAPLISRALSETDNFYGGDCRRLAIELAHDLGPAADGVVPELLHALQAPSVPDREEVAVGQALEKIGTPEAQKVLKQFKVGLKAAKKRSAAAYPKSSSERIQDKIDAQLSRRMKEFKTCSADSECVVVAISCGVCGTINQKFTEELSKIQAPARGLFACLGVVDPQCAKTPACKSGVCLFP